MPQPSLGDLRATFEPDSRRRSFVSGLTLFASVALLCALSFAGVLRVEPLLLKLLLGAILGLMISLLFVIGHDACHDSLTPSHRLNVIIGRLCFLPTLHPYTCWELGHNQLHHGWTNLKGVDYVYTPFTLEEFRALPATRRLLERVYRSVPGMGVFYLIEIWWKHMIVPRATDFAKFPRGSYIRDVFLVAAFFAGALAVTWLSAESWRQALINLAFGMVLPFVVWNWLMAFVTIQHHTHPQSAWFADEEEWSFFHAQIHGTIHIRLPRWIELLFHNILDHTAHHVDPKIPLYNLPECQRQLEGRYPDEIIIAHGSIPALHRVLRLCKLYDYEQHCWLDFEGKPSAPPIPLERWRRTEDPPSGTGQNEAPDPIQKMGSRTPTAAGLPRR